MNPKHKAYIRKRKKIQKILESIELIHDTDECYHSLSLWGYDATLYAEKILKSFGINKPTTSKNGKPKF